ncbi:ABC transporter permease [Corynebacterium sp. TAE3-ERU16]|uniref:ABC transporter permease n=1 Tax=Corynebacterium sp. TAE3-ERU16 TaxID=2849493 RepID=UPI001C49458C|nr:ABC transporter permease [Corynebacterium sp. TAE3-ERU16]MBV7292235.1 ABC transporter permease [Corynebacterium sp. TAE3-ERU16]
MLITLGKHILRYLATIFVASVAVFALMRVVPGDPAAVALGVSATPELIAAKREALGLDQPLVAQYLSWIGGMLRGDFGLSLTSGQDISPLVVDRLQVSLILVGSAMALALAAAIPVGTWVAMRHRRADGIAITALSQVGIAIPSFLAGILLVSVFAVRLGWAPANGWVPPDQGMGAFLRRLVMPVCALAAVQGAIMTRYVRSAVLEILSEDFIRTARAKGLSTWQALLRHGLRNAALPVITVTGVQLASLVIGAVVIEQVFVIPGLGSMLLDAVSTRDLTTVQTIVMVLVLLTLAVNMVVDLIALALDPRTGR